VACRVLRRAGRIVRKDVSMQDLLWIGVALGLAALTLAYVSLCEQA
jgi:hypothetical protein